MKKKQKESRNTSEIFERTKHFFGAHPELDAELAIEVIYDQYHGKQITLKEFQTLLEIIQFKVFGNFVNLITTFSGISKESWEYMIRNAHKNNHISTQQRITLLQML